MDNQYLQVVRRVEKLLKAAVRPDSIATQDMRTMIAKQPWAINFDAVADVYNSLYWTRNFWKAAYFFDYEYALTPKTKHRLYDSQTLDVTFVGSGAGPDVLALMVWCNFNLPFITLRLTVIDHSQKQLDLLAKFIDETKDLIDDIDVKVRYLHMDQAYWHPARDSSDLVILGHFLVENPHTVHYLLAKSKDAVREGGDIVVIERPDDTALLHAKQILANAGLTVHHTTTNDARVELVKQNLTFVGKTGISSHYLRATQPDKKRKSEIVSAYFEAWRSRSIEPIHQIFSADGSFNYRQDQIEPINNLDDMLDYWRTRPMRQSDVKVLIRNVTYTENVAICAFEGDLDTASTHEVVKGALTFHIDSYTNKIKHLAAHYGVTKTPR